MPADRSPQPAPLDAIVASALVELGTAGEALAGDGAPPRVAVAYSGGADSTALLHATALLQAAGTVRAVALHVHHGLAPSADAWLVHCREQAERLDVAFDVEHVAVPRDRASVEAEARRLRYAALARLCRTHRCAVLMTAHHADDQAETVLINLARGTGIGGLAGAARSRRLDEHTMLLRPWLDVPVERLRAHLETHGLLHVEDPSNRDRRFTRNAIRLEVMPALRRIVPSIAVRLAQTAAHASTLQGLLDEIGDEDLRGAQGGGDPDAIPDERMHPPPRSNETADDRPAGDIGTAAVDGSSADESGGLDVERLRSLGDARAANALRVWLAQRGMRAPSTAALREMLAQLLHASPSAQIALLHEQQTLRLYRGRVSIDHGTPASAVARPIVWHGEDAVESREWGGVLRFVPAVGAGLDGARLREGPLLLRARRGGERLRMRADGPSRTLKNLYQEAGIAAWQRARLPLVYLGDRLVFAAGLGMDQTALTDAGDDAIELRWEPLA